MDNSDSKSLKSLIEKSSKSNLQVINLEGDDSKCLHKIEGEEVLVIPSKSKDSNSDASSKIKFQSIVRYDWEHIYYHGNMVISHINKTHFAYILKSKSGSVVRVANKETNQRGLLKDFAGVVVDMSFASIEDRVVLAVVDSVGKLYVHELHEDPHDGKIVEELLLQSTVANQSESQFHRVVWCSFIKEDNTTVSSSSPDVTIDDSLMLLLTHDHNAELWHLDMILRECESNLIDPSTLSCGYYKICGHSKPIVEAAFSPDGTAVATASMDGSVKFFQINTSEDEVLKLVHQWRPHGGEGVSFMHFLDDHANKNLDVQLWKYVLTGCHSSGELKLWDCQMWSCIQTIYLHPSLVSCSFDSTTNHKTSSKNRLYHANNTSAVEKDADEIGCVIEFKCVGDDDDDDTSKDTSKAPHINNNNKNVNKDGGVREVCMKAKFDLSSTFLIMSDINRRVLYVLHVQNNKDEKVRFYILGEFLLNESCLSFDIRDISLVNRDDVDNDDSDASLGSDEDTQMVSISLFTVHPKSLQSLQLLYSLSGDVVSSEVGEGHLKQGKTDATDVPTEVGQQSEIAHFLPTFPAPSSFPEAPFKLIQSDLPFKRHQESGVECTATEHINENFIQHNNDKVDDTSEAKMDEETRGLVEGADRDRPDGGSRVIVHNNTTSQSNSQPIRFFDRGCDGVCDFGDGSSDGSSASQEITEIFENVSEEGKKDDYDLAHPEREADAEEKDDEVGDDNDENQFSNNDYKHHKAPANKPPPTSDWPQIDVLMQKSQAMENNMNRKKITADSKELKQMGTQICQLLEVCKAQREEMTQMSLSLQQREKQHQACIRTLTNKIDALSTQVLPSLHHNINILVDEAVKSHLKTVTSKLEESVRVWQGGVVEEVALKLNNIDANLKNTIIKTLKSKQATEALQQSICEDLKGCVKSLHQDVMVPSLNKSSQAVFKQISGAFNIGTQQYMRGLEGHLSKTQKCIEAQKHPLIQQLKISVDKLSKSEFVQQQSNAKMLASNACVQKQLEGLAREVGIEVEEKLASRISLVEKHLVSKMMSWMSEELKGLMKVQQMSLKNQFDAALRSINSTPTSSQDDLKFKINDLLKQRLFDSAFETALSAMDIHLVQYVCGEVQLSEVFTDPPLLSQSTLLSLIQQLSTDLTSNPSLKFKFLDEGLVALDITDPVTNEHLHSIVSKLCSNLESCIKNNSKPDLQQTMSHLLKRAKFTLRSHASSRNAEVSNMTF